MNNQVAGPFETEKLPGVPGFTLATLICPETPAAGEAPGWKAPSAYPEVLAVFNPAPAPAQPPRPAAESPLAMTMRGTLIEEPVIEEPPARVPDPAPVPAPESPLAMTMRGTLIEEPVAEEPAPAALATAEPRPAQAPAQTAPPAAAPAQAAPAALTVEEMRARLASLESAVAELKALLAPPAPKKD
jgi:hypothetical protein